MSLVAWSILTYALLIFACVVLQPTRLALTGGMKYGLSNRDTVPPEKSAFAHRIDRTLGNLKEGGAMYLPLALLAVALDASNPWVHYAALATMISRALYVPIYLAGVPVVRTLVWTPSLLAVPAMAYGIWLGAGQ